MSNEDLMVCNNCGQMWGYPGELHYCSMTSAPQYTNQLLRTLLQEIVNLRKDLAEMKKP